MHYLVRLVVKAESAEEAKHEAEYILDNLVQWGEFDYYRLEGGESGWKDCWTPVPLGSEKGKAWAQDALNDHIAEFKDAMAAIREIVANYTDEEILEEKFNYNASKRRLSRYQFSKISGYHGKSCLLFDECGDTIANQHLLDAYLANPDSLWVMQVDCHS